jgi:hypothetical protein
MRKGMAYACLESQEQLVYSAILKAIGKMQPYIEIPRISSDRIMTLLKAVLSDNPGVVYFNSTGASIYQIKTGWHIKLDVPVQGNAAVEMAEELDAKASHIADGIRANASSQYEMASRAYEYIQSHVKYDNEELMRNDSSEMSLKFLSHNAYGALVNGIAVCDGFSAAFSLIAEKLGIMIMSVQGKRSRSHGAKQGHTWNIVRLGNECYHADVTWESDLFELFGEYSYNYFMLDDNEFLLSHGWDLNDVPPCSDKTGSYYKANGLLIDNPDQMRCLFKAFGSARQRLVRVKLSFKPDLGENPGKFLVDELLPHYGGETACTYNWDENTSCFIAKIS